MTPISLPHIELLAVEVPEDVRNNIYYGYGRYTLIGLLSDITEETAAGIVENDNDGNYKDYLISRAAYQLKTALESLQSLLTSHRLKGNNIVLLKKEKE